METERILDEYRSRERRLTPGMYSILRSANACNVRGLEQGLLQNLAEAGIADLSPLQFLDVGCGTGGQLLRWIQWGARPERCHGVELIPERVQEAKQRLAPTVEVLHSDASRLPFGDSCFDITTQFTVFSTILDEEMQMAVAREMLRVTRPGGFILSYDFFWNPINRSTRGVGLKRLRQMFPGCRMHARRITLAPPITRKLASVSPLFCELMEAVRLFNSHLLVKIFKSAET
jgi:SAM-dependent methyltransferase